MIRVHSKLLTGLVMSDLFSAAMQGDLATLEVAQKAGKPARHERRGFDIALLRSPV